MKSPQNSSRIPLQLVDTHIKAISLRHHRILTEILIASLQKLIQNPFGHRWISIGSLRISYRNPCRIHIEILQHPSETVWNDCRNPRRIIIGSCPIEILQNSHRDPNIILIEILQNPFLEILLESLQKAFEKPHRHPITSIRNPLESQ